MSEAVQRQFLDRAEGYSPEQMPSVGDPDTANAITIKNRSGHDYVVAVANQVLGVVGSGYVKNGADLKIPTSWAWWDVYGLSQTSASHIFLKGTSPVIAETTWSKKMVGWKDSVTIE